MSQEHKMSGGYMAHTAHKRPATASRSTVAGAAPAVVPVAVAAPNKTNRPTILGAREDKSLTHSGSAVSKEFRRTSAAWAALPGPAERSLLACCRQACSDCWRTAYCETKGSPYMGALHSIVRHILAAATGPEPGH